MNEPALNAAPAAQPDAEQAALAMLGALRDDKADRLDPARFHFLEVMARRMLSEPGRSRQNLADKLIAALAVYDKRFRQARQAAGEVVAGAAGEQPGLAREMRRLFAEGELLALHRLSAKVAVAVAPAALVQLNQYIRTATRADQASGLDSDGDAKPDLKSARRFRETWSRISSERQLDQAVGRGPENAGPLNSHSLVLQSLAMMRGLSPDYLQRFLSHAGSLLWLEKANHQQGALDKDVGNKPKLARAGRPKK